MVRVQSTVVDH